MIIHRLQYAHGVVASIDTLKTFEVQFDDGTLCSEMSIKDIIVSLHVLIYMYTFMVSVYMHKAISLLKITINIKDFSAFLLGW